VTVCVNYADFLQSVIPENIAHIDEWTIVTSPDDGDTKRLCKQWGLKCLPTRVFWSDDSKFNKARGINYGLANSSCKGWMLHLDADTVLPPRTRHFLDGAALDTTAIHGIDRVNCVGYPAWAEFKASPEIQFEWSCLVKAPRGRQWGLGARIAHRDYGGYVPLGFFQLWHRDSGITRYPIVQDGDAEHTDVLHSLQWERGKRVLIPEILAIHLESEASPMGANWKGRTTKPFRPEAGGGVPFVRAGR
jgi:hypothetical protein